MKAKFSNFLVVFIAFICGGLTMYYFNNKSSLENNNYQNQPDVIVNENKESFITTTNNSNDNDLSIAISNIYDATVMVNNYNESMISNTGSGFVYKIDDSYGYIITNHHVIENSEKITLFFNDDDEVEATLLGSDKYLDIAVLKVDKNLVKKVATIGKNSKCKLGDVVLSIGSPLGFEYKGTVTNGIISGLNRLVSVSVNGNGDDWMMEVIQTNTAVNPGNSGGPLVNAKGEVIGVISLKLVKDSVEGMGFAIPIDFVMNHIDILETGKKIERPLLGISMLNVSASVTLEKYYDIKLDKRISNGVVVVDIDKRSGAGKSSLKKGDVITKIGDKNVSDVAVLKYLLYKYNVGDVVELTYYRNGTYNKTKITLTKSNE